MVSNCVSFLVFVLFSGPGEPLVPASENKGINPQTTAPALCCDHILVRLPWESGRKQAAPFVVLLTWAEVTFRAGPSTCALFGYFHESLPPNLPPVPVFCEQWLNVKHGQRTRPWCGKNTVAVIPYTMPSEGKDAFLLFAVPENPSRNNLLYK